MDKLPDASDRPSVSEKQDRESNTLMLVAAMADTTWRMFTPTIGLTLLGVWLDRIWQTKPWFMVAGIIVGAYVAYVLVKRQINQSKRIGTK